MMTRASRIILARELLHCARMVLDASCDKEAKMIIAKPRDRIRNLVKKYDESGLYGEATQNHVIEEKCTIHHMSGTKYYIATDTINKRNV